MATEPFQNTVAIGDSPLLTPHTEVLADNAPEELKNTYMRTFVPHPDTVDKSNVWAVVFVNLIPAEYNEKSVPVGAIVKVVLLLLNDIVLSVRLTIPVAKFMSLEIMSGSVDELESTPLDALTKFESVSTAKPENDGEEVVDKF